MRAGERVKLAAHVLCVRQTCEAGVNHEARVDVWKPDVAQLFGARSPATPRPDVAALPSPSTLYLPGSQSVSGQDPHPGPK